jgi:hypothetical protein
VVSGGSEVDASKSPGDDWPADRQHWACGKVKAKRVYRVRTTTD